MSIGAKGIHILMQFLIEAVIISVTGGVLGVLLGVGASCLIPIIAGWPVSVQAYSIILSFLVCTLTGVFFVGIRRKKLPDLILLMQSGMNKEFIIFENDYDIG